MKKSYAATFLDDPYHMNEEIYSLIMCRNLFVKLNQSTNWRENYRNKYLPSLAQPSECRETLLIELEGHWHTANQSPWCFTLPPLMLLIIKFKDPQVEKSSGTKDVNIMISWLDVDHGTIWHLFN